MPANSSTDEYIYEEYTPAHDKHLQALFLDAFQSKTSLEEITKKYDTSSLGLGVIGFIALHRITGMAVAFYGVFPVKMIYKEELIMIAQSGDTMTHSQHRQKGLFVQLAKMTFEQCIKKGVKIVFGQPNQYSYHGLVNRLGFKQVDEIARWDMKLKLKTFPWPKLAMRLGIFHSLYMRYARFVIRKIKSGPVSSFTNTLETENAKIYRDGNYIQYKARENKFFIAINGIMLWISLMDILWIGEISSYHQMTMQDLKQLRRLAFRLGYNTISFNLNNSLQPGLPEIFREFKKSSSQASCFLYLDEAYKDLNITLTAADSDTW